MSEYKRLSEALGRKMNWEAQAEMRRWKRSLERKKKVEEQKNLEIREFESEWKLVKMHFIPGRAIMTYRSRYFKFPVVPEGGFNVPF